MCAVCMCVSVVYSLSLFGSSVCLCVSWGKGGGVKPYYSHILNVLALPMITECTLQRGSVHIILSVSHRLVSEALQCTNVYVNI